MRRTGLQSVLAIVLMVIAGCGFQLRGTTLFSDNIQVVEIKGIPVNSPLSVELTSALIQNGLTVSTTTAERIIVTILSYDTKRTVLSVGTDAKVNEYELRRQLSFSVSNPQGEQLLTRQVLNASQDFQEDEAVLGREAEQALIESQLQSTLIQQLLRRLAAIQ